MQDFNLRLVAYQPNGPRIGPLPQPLETSFSNTYNEVPSLTFTYSSLGAKSEILDDTVEVAVEYSYDGTWQEADNGRFLCLQEDSDYTDSTGALKYTCPGYAWMFQKAIMTMSPAQRSKTGKRSFTDNTAGQILATMVVEAQARSTLPGVSFAFRSDKDSAGAAWSQKVKLSFDVGTPILSVLRQLADQGVIDWNMNKRELRVFNAGAELSAPRASARALTADTEFFLPGLTDDWASQLSSTPGAGIDNNPKHVDVQRFGPGALGVATHGNPGMADLGYTFLHGTDTWTHRECSVWLQKGSVLDDGRELAWGGIVSSFGARTSLVIGTPRLGNGSNMEVVARQVLYNRPGTTMVMSGTTDDAAVDKTTWSGYYQAMANMMRMGLCAVELVTFPVASLLTHDVVLQECGAPDTGIRYDIQTALQAKGFRVLFDNGANIPSRPAQLVTTATKLGSWAKATKVRYVRLAIRDDWSGDAPKRQAIADAITSATTLYQYPQLQWASPKPREDVPIDDPTRLGPVDLRIGRDLTEAPTTMSLTDLVGRVHAFGDSWTQTVTENSDAWSGWGVWEAAVGAGGVEDQETLDLLTASVIEKGMSRRYQMTRGLTFYNSRWVPLRDYDPGDYVLCSISGGRMNAQQVQQIVLTLAPSGELSGSIVMADRFQDARVKQARAIASASGGSVAGTSTGGSGVRPVAPVADKRRPRPPTGLG